MFSKKYKENLLKERVDKLNQLDKIEFENKIIYQEIKNNNIDIVSWSCLIISGIIGGLSLNFLSKIATYNYLQVGPLVDLQGIFFGFSWFFAILFYLVFLFSIYFSFKRKKQFQEENEQFLEERLKK